MQMEVIELQSNDSLKDPFSEGNLLKSEVECSSPVPKKNVASP
jgi:hypothetical protein